MSSPIRVREQALALAAVVQAAQLVDQLARTGTAAVDAMQALSSSLFRLEWDSVDEVFGGAASMRKGLEILRDLLSLHGSLNQAAMLRYALALLYLARALTQDRQHMQSIRSRLQQTGQKSTLLATDFDELTSDIATIYQDTVSTFRYRVQVAGSAQYLQNPRIAARIRMLLFAGIRAAVLWRHLGGSRLQVLLGRGVLLRATQELLAECRSNPG